jgi:hypothetical protein
MGVDYSFFEHLGHQAKRLLSQASVSYVSETSGTRCSVMTLNPRPSLCLCTAQSVQFLCDMVCLPCAQRASGRSRDLK